ncbi:nucleotide exchange factor GrpE [Virgibacillus sp. LDC-1]|uniref:nucleotide exchange factor GrpE n=1 Tax=Virgibacillus sp. LDC-1 TaxID=3039856 RepID=UPI0024DE0CE8|nr:nucleotide exchange factor GrpE [Virgibacillus sp. LDC-1]
MEEKSTDKVMEENKENEVEQEVIIDEEIKEQNLSSDDEAVTDDLHKEMLQLQQEKDEMYQRLLRIQAEYDNFKKRTQKEKAANQKYKAQDLVTELLPAIDNFDRALQTDVPEEAESYVEGISMVYRQLIDALKSQGVVEVQTVGEEFDPNLHHAVMQVEDSEKPSNIIVEELQKGYMLKDRVIRPAMVKVNK